MKPGATAASAAVPKTRPGFSLSSRPSTVVFPDVPEKQRGGITSKTMSQRKSKGSEDGGIPMQRRGAHVKSQLT